MNLRPQELRRQLRLGRRHARYGLRALSGGAEAWKLDRLDTLYRELNRLLRALEVDYWICYGTLLGWHREGALLRHDVDVDFGLHERGFDRVWAARAELPRGLRMFDTSWKHRGPKLYVELEGWECDLYFYEDRDGLLRSYERSSSPRENEPFPRALVYPLQDATFLGESTRVPAQPEAWLRHNYGYIGRDAVQDRRTGLWHPLPQRPMERDPRDP